MKAAMWWPAAIIGVLGVTVAANALLLYEASDPNGDAMEPDYYRKAVAWDSTLAENARGRLLGWQLDARLDPDSGGARVTARLTDPLGVPVDGANLTVAAIHNLGGGRFVGGALAARGAGVYSAVMPLEHAGRWELRLDARRGPDRFATTLHRELARAGAPGR